MALKRTATWTYLESAPVKGGYLQPTATAGAGMDVLEQFASDLTLYAASTQEVDNKDLSTVTLTTVAGEAMWDAVLASVPDNATFTPPATQRR